MSSVPTEPNTITIISLVIAALAVIVGPLISFYASKRQNENSLQIAKQQMLGPMRQVWINELRSLVVEITSSCMHYWQTGTYQDLGNDEYKRITHLQHKIELMINPSEKHHASLLEEVKKMVNTTNAETSNEDKEFFAAYNSVIKMSQKVLKQEWNVIKNT